MPDSGRIGTVVSSAKCAGEPEDDPNVQRTTTPPLDQEMADRLSALFHRCFSDFEAADDLFAPDAFYDLLPPMWRVQLEGPGEVFTNQLRAISEGPIEIEVVRTVPTATGFVTEHVETQHTSAGVMVARRLHLCEVRDGRIETVTTYCNGGWDDDLRARHAADAPMIRPGSAELPNQGDIP